MNASDFPHPAEIDACLLVDRDALRRRLHGLQQRQRRGQAFEQGLIHLWRDLRASQAVLARRRAQVPTIDYPADLPISDRRGEIAALIERHPVVILCGETGSGKSTQLPKICLDLGRGLTGRIGHTQPRRLAARTLATRIAAELGGETGPLVGYKVRFQDRVRPETAVKLMTDGILLAEIQSDRSLTEYDTLIIDEAHERSLNIDFLLGYLKGLLPHRPDLKLIVTSATIDPQRFSAHFGGAPIIEVSGRTFPVEVRYRPPDDDSAGERDEAMQTAISEAVAELAREGRGDVLVFLSGEREIRETAETLRKRHPPSTEILPLYARLGPREQTRVFEPHGTRRVVLATNVAETSLTVPGIHYVVDPGFARISRYSHRSRVQRLPVERVSQASADQRRGRCGRVAAGVCIRLYSEDNFAARAPFTEPEVVRTNLAAVILRMKQLGFGAIEGFPFLEPPDGRLIQDGYRTLEELAALDQAGRLTPLGRQLARLPVDPRIARMLFAAIDQRCLAEVLIIAAALSIQDPRERPVDRQQAADEIHATFQHPESDFLTFLNLWRFLERERQHLSKAKFRQLCQRHFLSWNRVQEWRDTHAQLREQLHTAGFIENRSEAGYDEVHRALLAGLLSHIGFKDESRSYLGARGSRFQIHPSSALFAKPPKWIMAAERVETTRPYGRIVARIQPAWIEEVGRHLVQRSYSEPHWQARAGQVAAYEKVTLYGITLIARRRINYGPINPAEAREIFLRSALVDGDFTTRAPFWRHNQELIAYVRHLEAKSRRRDILVDEEAIYAFYAERIPTGLYSTPQFERWLRQIRASDPKRLHMGIGDLMRRETSELSAAAFPDHLPVSGSALPLEYRFEPGEPGDGVTLVVPLPLLGQVAVERGEWLVPGLLVERITALLRGLPKTWRRSLVPIPDTATQLARRLTASDRPLIQALGEALQELKGVAIPEDAWDLDAIPPHLRMHYRLVDHEGRTLAHGEDLNAIKREHGGAGRASFARIPTADLERDGLTRWDFGDLPESIELTRAGIRMRGYPALIDEGDQVALRVLDAAERAEQATRAGVRRLIALHLASEVRSLRARLPGLDRMRLQYAKAPWPSGEAERTRAPDLADDLIALILERTFVDEQAPLRDQAAFLQRLTERRPFLPATLDEVCTLVRETLDRYQGLRQRLASVSQINWMASVQDLRGQLDGLIFKGFLLGIPYQRLQSYPRFLRAAEYRAERLSYGAAKDREWMHEMAGLQRRWNERAAAARAAGRSDLRLEEIRWMLEELRVSLFAQQVGTAYPVSVKRIEARWRELGL
ncbi:ATP-dependent RNA helicase HrpA [Thioalkalicoccus limnaeus]|uniref:ATP-dependent RNA helicase HrpA n=1 Tax=Thioalkalicoccus limnaeus TaxID=120681 RepID=A0ABV4BDQ2_9GAMM